VDLSRRLARLEQRRSRRRRTRARAGDVWRFRYTVWQEQGWPEMPPPTQPLTLPEFQAAWLRLHGPTPPQVAGVFSHSSC
jgi:hypothetical protein